jgi:hypothetical protein
MFGHADKHPIWVTMKRAVCIVAPAIFAATPGLSAEPAHTQPQQSAESFEAAIHNRSTSQSFVLITVVNDATGQATTGCTMAPFLLGAIHMEHGLAFDEAGNTNAVNMAIATANHVFHFSRPDALENVSFRYSPAELEAARRRVQPLTDQQLREGLAVYRGSLQPTALGGAREALACALVERGLSVRLADRSGEVILDP